MKRSELRPGNIVRYEGGIAPIYDLSREVVWFDEGSVAALIEDVSPVPITEEILEKNGWRDAGKQYYTNGWCYLFQTNEKRWGFGHGTHLLHLIEYVHELQHLLWALGMDDDLKI